MTIILEPWDQMHVRVWHTDATCIRNHPFRIEYRLERLCHALDLHKHEANIRLVHVPDPAIVPLRNKLRVPWIEGIAIEKPEILRILINDLMRIVTSDNIAKH